MTFPVKYLHSAMRGAPVLSGTAGTLVSMIDACLLTGFGQVTLTSLVVAGGVATATVSAGDTFDEYAVILIDGASPAALNGEQRVLSSTATTFTFATTAPDGAATGTITAKYAPVGGWEKSFSGTNKAVYQSIDPQANGHVLRVDDTSTKFARVLGLESATDIDTGVGPFPTEGQMAGGGYWWRSTVATGAAVKWSLFGDSRMFMPAIAAGSGNLPASISSPLRGFGDPIALRPGGDSWGTVLSSLSSNSSYAGYANLDGGDHTSFVSTLYGTIATPRGLGGSGSAVLHGSAAFVSTPSSSGAVSGDDSTFGPAPSTVDGQLRLSRRYIGLSDRTPRAIVPGVFFVPQTGALSLLPPGSFLDGSGDLSGRRLVAVPTARSFGTPSGVYLMDITGPWR